MACDAPAPTGLSCTPSAWFSASVWQRLAKCEEGRVGTPGAQSLLPTSDRTALGWPCFVGTVERFGWGVG